MRLDTITRQLPDGRVQVKYDWSLWTRYHIQYFDDMAQAAEFVAKLMTKTKWK